MGNVTLCSRAIHTFFCSWTFQCSNNIYLLFSQYLECTGLCVYTIYGCMCIHIHKYIHKNESLVSIRTCMSAHLFIDFLPSLESVLHGDEASFFFADSILYYIPKGIILSALSDLLLCLIKVTRCEANFSCSFY